MLVTLYICEFLFNQSFSTLQSVTTTINESKSLRIRLNLLITLLGTYINKERKYSLLTLYFIVYCNKLMCCH